MGLIFVKEDFNNFNYANVDWRPTQRNGERRGPWVSVQARLLWLFGKRFGIFVTVLSGAVAEFFAIDCELG